jgi:hypothetical protein
LTTPPYAFNNEDPPWVSDFHTTRVVLSGCLRAWRPGRRASGDGRWLLIFHAPQGSVPILIDKNDNKGLVRAGTLNVVDAVPGPIPPGINPQVDVFWTVLSPRITSDAFGGWVRKKYYAIEVVIGNNSGYELQITSVAFQMRNKDKTLSGPLKDDQMAQWNHSVTNDYHIVRSSTEREQLAGARAYVLSIAEAVALFGAGVTPFFKNVGHQATYSTAVSVFGNPVIKGMNSVWPDLTIPDLNRLDNLALHDNAIVANNSQTKTVVFIDRKILAQYFNRDKSVPADKDSKPSGPAGKGECEGAPPPSKLRKVKLNLSATYRPLCDENQPQDVKFWLGNLILVGNQIEFKQRIRVSAAKPEAVTPKLTVDPDEVTAAALSVGVEIKIKGADGDLTTIPAEPAQNDKNLSLKLDAPGLDKTMRTGVLKATGSKLLPAGPYAVQIPFEGTVQNLNISVKKE